EVPGDLHEAPLFDLLGLRRPDLPWFLHRAPLPLQGLVHRVAYEARYRRARRAYDAAVRRARADVLHVPFAVDTWLCPDGWFECRSVATFLDAIPLQMREIYDASSPMTQLHYDRQLARLAGF